MQRILTGLPDWETEIGVELTGYGIHGTADAYHRPTGTVVDWKFVGYSSLKGYRDNGPGPQYRTQAHLYGCGLALAGREVDHVAIVFIPRSGLSSGIHVWSEPYDPGVVEAAMARYDAVQTVVGAVGPAGVPTADANCSWCPWHDPQTPDLDRACPGHNAPIEGAQA
jgi:hypothetical protein